MFDITEIEEYTKKDNIIDGIMKSKGLYCLVSNAKVGKSMFSIQLSNSLVNNKQFLDVCKMCNIATAGHPFDDALQTAVNEYNLSRRKEIPNLLSEEYALKK